MENGAVVPHVKRAQVANGCNIRGDPSNLRCPCPQSLPCAIQGGLRDIQHGNSKSGVKKPIRKHGCSATDVDYLTMPGDLGDKRERGAWVGLRPTDFIVRLGGIDVFPMLLAAHGKSIAQGNGGLNEPAVAVLPPAYRADDLFRAAAARMSFLKASASISSPSWKSIARLVLLSRLELNSPEGSLSEAPLANVTFTTLL